MPLQSYCEELLAMTQKQLLPSWVSLFIFFANRLVLFDCTDRLHWIERYVLLLLGNSSKYKFFQCIPNSMCVCASEWVRKQEYISSATRIQLKICYCILHWFGLANNRMHTIAFAAIIVVQVCAARTHTIARWARVCSTIRNVAQYFKCYLNHSILQFVNVEQQQSSATRIQSHFVNGNQQKRNKNHSL